MPKGVEKDQLANSGTAVGMANQANANAANIYGGLEPMLQAQAANPTGYTPAQVAMQNTAAMQSAGGANAAAVGGGGLYAARTHNAGAVPAAIGDSIRSTGQTLSDAAVGVQQRSAELAQHKQQQGLAGLGGLYDTELGAGQKDLGLSNEALSGADQSAANNPWTKIALQTLQSAGQVGSAFAKGTAGGGGGG